LHGGGPPDLVECTLVLGAEMLVLAGKAREEGEARALLGAAITRGDALAVMRRMVAAQGGDAKVVDDPSRLPLAPETVVTARSKGFVATIDALEIGLAAVAMGAGRTRSDQRIDPSLGICIDAVPGARVAEGAPLARLFTPKPTPELEDRVRAAFAIEDLAQAPGPRPLVIGRVDG
jgi:thymidine phosphorylase